jgi:hypothetical protein
VKISKESISAYRAALLEYEKKFIKYLKGMQDGHKAYTTLEQDMKTIRDSILMIERMYPNIVEHKPKVYKARY